MIPFKFPPPEFGKAYSVTPEVKDLLTKKDIAISELWNVVGKLQDKEATKGKAAGVMIRKLEIEIGHLNARIREFEKIRSADRAEVRGALRIAIYSAMMLNSLGYYLKGDAPFLAWELENEPEWVKNEDSKNANV